MILFETDAFYEAGYYLEVGAADPWHSFLAGHSRLSVNLGGVLITLRDGTTLSPPSYLPNATPSLPGMPPASPGVQSLDDVTLRPGMEVHYPELSLTNVVGHPNGSISLDVTTSSTARDVLYRITGITAMVASDTLTFSWADAPHGSTSAVEIEATRPDASTSTYTQSNPAITSLAVAIAANNLVTGTTFRLGAAGGGLHANWSRVLTDVVP